MPDFINELKSSTYKKGVTVTPKILFLFYSRIKQEFKLFYYEEVFISTDNI